MKNLILKLYEKAGIRSTRTKNITKHVLLSFVYKGGSIIANFLLVPLTIKYLDNENYGIWLTLSSFIAWFSFLDIGLGHGLRNKFAEAKAKGDIELARGYVSTAYYTIGSICLILTALAILISYNINWTKVFNTSEELHVQLQLLVPIVFGCFGLQLIVQLITTIYTADLKPSVQGMISFITATTSLLAIWLLTYTNKSSLLLFGIIFSLLPVIILFTLNLYAFSNRYKDYKPKRLFWKKHYFKDIFGLGVNFFVIQFSMIVLYTTDNFIITQLFGPKEVVPYNIAYKYLGISSMFFIMILTPYWSSVTEAIAKNEFDWIKKSMKTLIKLAILTVFLIFLMVFIAPLFYKIWIGDLVAIPFNLTISMAIFYSISVLFAPFNYFINGIGKIKLHMYSFAIAALLNLPLSIILVKYVNLGIEGVIIATIICILPNVVLFPIQYFRLMNKTARGIWNK